MAKNRYNILVEIFSGDQVYVDCENLRTLWNHSVVAGVLVSFIGPEQNGNVENLPMGVSSFVTLS